MAAADECNKIKAKIFYEDGYDHGYYFISSFMEEHIKFHCSILASYNK